LKNYDYKKISRQASKEIYFYEEAPTTIPPGSTSQAYGDGSAKHLIVIYEGEDIV